VGICLKLLKRSLNKDLHRYKLEHATALMMKKMVSAFLHRGFADNGAVNTYPINVLREI